MQNQVSVKEGQALTLEWKTNFALSNDWFIHILFKPTGSTKFGNFPIATVVNKNPQKNPKSANFFQKISSVQLLQPQSSSFIFKLTISNMAITEEGTYQLKRSDVLGNLKPITSNIDAGVIGKYYDHHYVTILLVHNNKYF